MLERTSCFRCRVTRTQVFQRKSNGSKSQACFRIIMGVVFICTTTFKCYHLVCRI